MAPSRAPSTRKRGRPRNDDSPAIETSAAKKQRLNASAPPKRTEAAAASAETKSAANGKGKKTFDRTKEIPESEEDETVPTQAQSKRRGTATTTNGVYDFPGSDEELNQLPSTRSKAKVESTASTRSTSTKSASSTATGTKSSTRGNAVLPAGRGKGDAALAAAIKRSRGAARRSKAPIRAARDQSAEASGSDDVLTRQQTNMRASAAAAATASPQKTSGGTPLKGILTPSRRLSKHNPKSVAFDDSLRKGKDEIFFADLPSSSKTAKGKPTSQKTRLAGKENKPLSRDNDTKVTDNMDDEEEQSDEDEDEEVCVICSKPDSKRPNEILFCDSCDMAVHQKCYGVDKIPKGDWFCKDCAADGKVDGSGDAATEKSASMAVAETVPDIPNFEHHLRAMQRVLFDRCTGRRLLKLRDLDDAYEKTYQLVEQTVLAGEGNSMLIIGARGCGKTTMVETVLSDIGAEHRDEFHVVRLNGFIHTDDKLALKDIWRQLGKEMEVEDDLISKTNNYADILASLLALLSHPSELAESQDGVTSKSVVFIIDEFDMFATHARQTLLYNLFDISQSRKAPIAVLGLTAKIDVVESLEKRVKSRFSHRYVYLSLAKTFAAYWNVCKQGLVVEDEDAKAEGLDTTLAGFAQFQEYWADKVEALSKQTAFKDHIESYYYGTKSVPAFLTSCILPLANLTPADMTLRFHPSTNMDPPDSKLHLLTSLSELDLALLISAARLEIVAHTDTVNFAMAYDEYTTLMGRQRVRAGGMLTMGGAGRVWGRGVAEMAWERLGEAKLLLPTGGARQQQQQQQQAGSRMWKVDVTLEEIPVSVKLNSVLARWCREI